MNFRLVDKKYLGFFLTLFLMILLSQSRFFHFLIDKSLGRLVLIFFILGITYTSKILGIVAVLFIIIMFNQNELSYMEGFTDNVENSLNTQEIKDKINLKKDEIKTKLPNLQNQVNSSTTTSSEPTTTTSTNNTSTSESFEGREGFNIIDRESSILKGKRSNEIPVFSNTRKQTDNIEPYDNNSSTPMTL
jgi:hypothetical protein